MSDQYSSSPLSRPWRIRFSTAHPAIWIVLVLGLLGIVALLLFGLPLRPEGEIAEASSLEHPAIPRDITLENPDPIVIEHQSSPEPEKPKLTWPVVPPPPPVNMTLLKKKGCVTDGILSGYGGDENSSLAMINRSECYYLHRALETWLHPPDFDLAFELRERITKPNTVYGMFLAEAIDTKAELYYPDEDREFDFGDMCRKGSKNFWGEHTCKPSFEREEYRKYLDYITRRAMDMGIQVFMFGQIYLQDSNDLSRSRVSEIMDRMREYAKIRGMEIVIGAQTNDITDAEYLGQFDFIEGGVGINGDGEVQGGPCHTRWWKKEGDWCWGLLWNPVFSSKAKNVLLHLDWSGKTTDDMAVFSRMNKTERATTLRSLYKRFSGEKTGFLMPMMARLHRDNGGCYGNDKHYYSASRKYSCQDEEVINVIFRGK